MNKFILLILTAFCYVQIGQAQDSLNHDNSTITITLKNSSRIAISKTPITNRDYLIYIMWKMNVYGADYPEVLLEVFPTCFAKNKYELYSFYEASNPLEYFINNSTEQVRNYMFNVDYIDYPVIGLSWQQAFLFNKWLSDRYNEHLLFELGLYKISKNEINEDCFVTESYLSDLYHGSGRLVDTLIKWEDSIFLPCFRLPTKTELNSVKSDNLSIKLKPYKPRRFLKPWENQYLSITKNEIYFYDAVHWGADKKTYKISKPEIEWNTSSINIEELFLDYSNENNKLNYLEAFAMNGFENKPVESFQDHEGYFWDKDSLGLSQHIIVGTDKTGQPILIQNSKHRDKDKKNNQNYTVFRYVVNLRNKQ